MIVSHSTLVRQSHVSCVTINKLCFCVSRHCQLYIVLSWCFCLLPSTLLVWTNCWLMLTTCQLSSGSPHTRVSLAGHHYNHQTLIQSSDSGQHFHSLWCCWSQLKRLWRHDAKQLKMKRFCSNIPEFHYFSWLNSLNLSSYCLKLKKLWILAASCRGTLRCYWIFK